MKKFFWIANVSTFFLTITTLACNRHSRLLAESPVCAPQEVLKMAPESSSSGNALAFLIDPITGSGDTSLSPFSLNLDDFRIPISLSHLTGRGILQGEFIDVVNGLECNMGFGAFDLNQEFIYSHSNWKFQEAMVYYFGDIYQTYLEQAGYLNNRKSVKLVAHCELSDNAYFTRATDSNGNAVQIVCLGDSVRSSGAFYADDGLVTLHELQHATTLTNYSNTERLNQLWYDEAGALNEAISDFMGLAFANQLISPNSQLDPRVFSRWALGTFDNQSSHLRGVHRCPQYDSNFPDCENFPAFHAPSVDDLETTISYVYPDGLGWPYPKNTFDPFPAQDVLKKFQGQEEIHNAGILMAGALWDIYSSLKANHAPDDFSVGQAMAQLVLESMRHLPMPNFSTNHSPVTFLRYASELVTYAPQIPGLTLQDQDSIIQALKNRGLYQTPGITNSDWLTAGPGTNWRIPHTPTPGIFIQDDPNILIPWLVQMGSDPNIIQQDLDTGLNNHLDRGEVAAIWFDLQNQSDVTAGGILLTVTSSDPDLSILDSAINIGYLSESGLNQTQVMYQKVNGMEIVSALNPPDALEPISIGPTYFSSNPYFNQNWRSAVWVRAASGAKPGKTVHLQVNATPANGVTSSLTFPITIH